MRQKVDREWYHIMTSSARIGYGEHVLHPTMTARPETLVHGREERVNTGWPNPHFVRAGLTPHPPVFAFSDLFAKKVVTICVCDV